MEVNWGAFGGVSASISEGRHGHKYFFKIFEIQIQILPKKDISNTKYKYFLCKVFEIQVKVFVFSTFSNTKYYFDELAKEEKILSSINLTNWSKKITRNTCESYFVDFFKKICKETVDFLTWSIKFCVKKYLRKVFESSNTNTLEKDFKYKYKILSF